MSNATATATTVREVGFFDVIRSAIRKDLAGLSLSSAVRDAANKYASNGGAKPLLKSLIVDCTTSPSGKVRTPAKGTVTACVLAALRTIEEQGPLSMARDQKNPDRKSIAASFAETIGTGFDLAVIDGSNARKAATAAKKAEKDADTGTGTATGTASDTAETASGGADTGTDYKALYLAALAENTQLKAQIEGLQQPAPRKVRSVKAA